MLTKNITLGPTTPRPDPYLHTHSSSSYRGPSIDEYRTYSLTQSSYITHSLTQRHPYVHAAHYPNRGPTQTFRSQSPFAYPTRLRRPGYRPSSPALSFNTSVPNSDPGHGQTSRTASPASMHTINGVPTAWQQLGNRSESLRYYYPPVPQTPSSRESTPKPASSLRSHASSQRLSQAQVMFPGAWPNSPALTPPPLFYDYSEGFEEQTHIHRTSLLVVTPSFQELADDQNDYFKPHQIPELVHRVELSAEATPTSEPEVSSLGHGDGASRSEIRKSPEEPRPHAQMQEQLAATPAFSTSTLEIPDPVSAEPISAWTPKNTMDHEDHQVNVGLSAEAEPDVEGRIEDQINVSSAVDDHKSIDGQHKDEQNLSSPAASMFSVQSSIHLDNIDDDTVPTSGTDTATASPKGPPRTPIYGSSSFEIASPDARGYASEASKASASVKSLRNDYPEILAPTPERSVTSLSSRDRFSKILGLDDVLLELDGPIPSVSRRAIRNSSTVSPIPKVQSRPQGKLSTLATADPIIAEESNSDDEQELANGFMKTFGRLSGSPPRDTTVKSNPNASPKRNRASPLILASRKPLGTEKPTATNVRLSHRKTVINGGQTREAESVPICHPSSTVSEKKVSGNISADLPTQDTPLSSDNRLPAIKSSPSIKAFAPPKNTSKCDLPFAFTPLIRPPSESDSAPELDATTSFYTRKYSCLDERGKSPLADSRAHLDRTSTASPPDSRPWNLDASYPWGAEKSPSLDVVSPLPPRESRHSAGKYPKFKLRIHRASSSNASKPTKKDRSSEDTKSSAIASSVDFLKIASMSRRAKPDLSIAPGQSNSSHDVIRASPMHTRFVESFEQPSPTSPTITLLPPSPGHDVRSFFSDDSSQVRPKGSLRKRLSDLRARNARSNSVEHVAGYDRGLLSSAFGLSRASGRSSRQSQTTVGVASLTSRTRRSRWWVFGKIRAWFVVRKRRKDMNNAPTMLYAGV